MMDDSLDFIGEVGSSSFKSGHCPMSMNGPCENPPYVFSIFNPKVQLCYEHFSDAEWTESFRARFRPLSGHYTCQVYLGSLSESCAAEANHLWLIEGASKHWRFGCADHVREMQQVFDAADLVFKVFQFR